MTTDCTICFNPLNPTYRGMVTVHPEINLMHRFCVECINGWIISRNTCPTCRSPIEAVQIHPSESHRPIHAVQFANSELRTRRSEAVLHAVICCDPDTIREELQNGPIFENALLAALEVIAEMERCLLVNLEPTIAEMKSLLLSANLADKTAFRFVLKYNNPAPEIPLPNFQDPPMPAEADQDVHEEPPIADAEEAGLAFLPLQTIPEEGRLIEFSQMPLTEQQRTQITQINRILVAAPLHAFSFPTNELRTAALYIAIDANIPRYVASILASGPVQIDLSQYDNGIILGDDDDLISVMHLSYKLSPEMHRSSAVLYAARHGLHQQVVDLLGTGPILPEWREWAIEIARQHGHGPIADLLDG